MQFELARTGKASLVIHGRLLASIYSTCSPVASIRQCRLRVFATNAGSYILHAALGDDANTKTYLCLSFKSLADLSTFLSDPDNLFHAVGYRLLAMARSSEKSLALIRADAMATSWGREVEHPGLGRYATA